MIKRCKMYYEYALLIHNDNDDAVISYKNAIKLNLNNIKLLM